MVWFVTVQITVSVRRMRVVQPWCLELVMLCSGPKVPEDSLTGSGQNRIANHLVHGPGADVGSGHVADVMEIEG
jgi:hypothetical protein